MPPILLRDLLFEQEKSERRDLKNWLPIIKKKCPVALDLLTKLKWEDWHDSFFYRGISSPESNLIYHVPSKKIRISKDSNNVSLFFTSEMSSWKKENIPPRNRSVIMAGGANTAGEYGKIYLVFPVGDPYIAYGTEGDNYSNYQTSATKIFGDPEFGVAHVDKMVATIVRSIEGINAPPHLTSSNPENVWKYINKIDDFLSDKKTTNIEKRELIKRANEHLHKDTQQRISKFYSILEKHGSLSRLMNKLYDPIENKIVSQKLSTFDAGSFPHGVEMWTDAPCFLVKYITFFNYINI